MALTIRVARVLCIVYVCVIAASVRVVVAKITERLRDDAQTFSSTSLQIGCDQQLAVSVQSVCLVLFNFIQCLDIRSSHVDIVRTVVCVWVVVCTVSRERQSKNIMCFHAARKYMIDAVLRCFKSFVGSLQLELSSCGDHNG